MKKIVRQILSFALVFFILACKEGDFLNQSKDFLLAGDEENKDYYEVCIKRFVSYDALDINGNVIDESMIGRQMRIEERYKGDNRGFSLNDDDTARLYHKVKFKKISLLLLKFRDLLRK